MNWKQYILCLIFIVSIQIFLILLYIANQNFRPSNEPFPNLHTNIILMGQFNYPSFNVSTWKERWSRVLARMPRCQDPHWWRMRQWPCSWPRNSPPAWCTPRPQTATCPAISTMQLLHHLTMYCLSPKPHECCNFPSQIQFSFKKWNKTYLRTLLTAFFSMRKVAKVSWVYELLKVLP